MTLLLLFVWSHFAEVEVSLETGEWRAAGLWGAAAGPSISHVVEA